MKLLRLKFHFELGEREWERKVEREREEKREQKFSNNLQVWPSGTKTTNVTHTIPSAPFVPRLVEIGGKRRERGGERESETKSGFVGLKGNG